MSSRRFQQILRQLRRLWQQGLVDFDGHALAQARARGLDDADVEAVVLQPHHVSESRPGVFVLRGRTVERQTVELVVELRGTMVLITVIRV